jgi:hypothetical protein
MAGHGRYNEHSAPQRVAGDIGAQLLANAAAAIPVDGGRGLVIADYGSSQGRNSLDPMRAAIQHLDGRLESSAPISVVHTDLPENDFAALFTTLRDHPGSYMRVRPNVFGFGAGVSFYEQIFPAGWISLGWSSIAVHWISRVPVNIRAHIFSPLAAPEERAAFAEQSAADWRAFLTHRAQELVAGGRLVVVGSGADDTGRSGAEGLLELANRVLRDMVGQEILSPAEYEGMAVPTYYRTEDEFTAPLHDGPLADLLDLESCSSTALSDPLWAEYERTGDLTRYAAGASEFLRAFSEPALFGSFAATWSQEAATKMADEFYGRVTAAIMASPREAACAWRLVVLSIVRRG